MRRYRKARGGGGPRGGGTGRLGEVEDRETRGGQGD